jgi:hypothetical protein
VKDLGDAGDGRSPGHDPALIGDRLVHIKNVQDPEAGGGAVCNAWTSP